MMFASIVRALFGLLFPAAPVWVADLVATVLPDLLRWVKEMEGASDLEGEAKFEYVMSKAQALIDHAFDGIPTWSEVSEEERDRMIGGLVEFLVGASRLASTKKERKALRKALRKLRR